MSTAGAQAARGESIPDRPATIVEIFGMPAIIARPEARGVRLPLAERATNPAEKRFFVIYLCDFIRRFIRQTAFLKKRKDDCQQVDSM